MRSDPPGERKISATEKSVRKISATHLYVSLLSRMIRFAPVFAVSVGAESPSRPRFVVPVASVRSVQPIKQRTPGLASQARRMGFRKIVAENFFASGSAVANALPRRREEARDSFGDETPLQAARGVQLERHVFSDTPPSDALVRHSLQEPLLCKIDDRVFSHC